MRCKLLFFLLFFSFSTLAQKRNVETSDGENIFYYPNGQISSIGLMKNAKPDGFWKNYYVNGILKSEGKRKTGLLDSVWVFYFENALIKEKINYLNGKKNGYYYSFGFFYNADNQLVSYLSKEYLYLNNLKHGLSTNYYKNGNIKSILPYKNGKRNGTAKFYDEEGKLISIIEYLNDKETDREELNKMHNSLKIGIWKEFYPNGKIKNESYYSQGKLHGLYKEYDLQGNLKRTYRYQHGTLVDTVVEIEKEIKIVEEFYQKRDSTGELIKKKTGGFVDGKPIGVHRTYDSLGRVNSSKLYDKEGNLIGKGIVNIEGDRVGDWIFFYKNGNKKSEGRYLKNRRSGFWIYYFESGKIEQQGTFKKGRPDGKWEWYFETGNLMRKEYYKNGKENGEQQEFNENQTLIAKGNYIDGLKEGKWFFDYGFHTETGNYKDDNRSGEWFFYYRNGKLYFKGSFIDGKENGEHFYFYQNGKLKEKRYYNFGQKEKNWEYYDYYGTLLKILTFENNKLIKIDGINVRIK